VALPRLIGGWAVATGALKVTQTARQGLRREWVLSIAGLGSIAVGLVLLPTPIQAPTTLALVWLIAAYALSLGIVLLLAGGIRVTVALRQ
jgi:uncharacterized membrane protein HdeD (DUF308 family)